MNFYFLPDSALEFVPENYIEIVAFSPEELGEALWVFLAANPGDGFYVNILDEDPFGMPQIIGHIHNNWTEQRVRQEAVELWDTN
jgi:hypothetical protein